MPDNLYKRGGIWWGRVKVGGRDIRRSLRTRSIVKARERVKVLLEEANHVRFAGTERISWKRAVVDWMEWAPGNLKPKVVDRYKHSLRNARPYLDDLYVDEINKSQLAKFVNARKKHVTNATIRRDLTAISSVMDFCDVQGWRDDNPAREFNRRQIKERRDPIVIPDDADIDYVVERCPGNFARMVRFAQHTGMREEECGGLDTREVRDRTVTLTKTKTSIPRAIDLNDKAWGTYEGTPRHMTCRYVFWHATRDGADRYHNIASRFRQIMKRAIRDAKKEGRRFRPFRFHDLRHWYAVDDLRSGGNIYDLQQDLGHKSIKTTEGYLAYLTPEEQKNAKYGARKGAQ